MNLTHRSSSVCVEQEGGIARITIGTGKRANALRTEDWYSITEIAKDLSRVPSLSTVLLKGAGLHFSAGSDLTEWDGASAQQVRMSFVAMEMACAAIEHLSVPTIAAIRGVAAGAGCQLALACDIRMLSNTARIGMPILRLGILTPLEFGDRLARSVGQQNARLLLYTGALVDGMTAQRIGLATRVVDPTALDAESESLVKEIASQPVSALRAAKATTEHPNGINRTSSKSNEESPILPEVFQSGIRAVLRGNR